MIGSGSPGLSDGPFEDAQLATPQGMALDGELLYIAEDPEVRVGVGQLIFASGPSR